MVAGSVNAGGCRALRNNHHKARSGDGNQQFHVVPTHIGQNEMGQPAGHRPNHGDAARRKVPSGSWPQWRPLRRSADREFLAQTGPESGRRPPLRLKDPEMAGSLEAEPPQHLSHLHNGPVGINLQTEHFSQHCNPNLKSHAGEKAHQDGSREEVGDETKL